MLFRETPVDPPPAPEVRRRTLDNPRVLIAAALLLLALLAGLSWLSDRTTDLALPVLTEVVLYPLLAVDVVLLLTLCFVLARNLLKLWVEQRQAAPFGRFRVKLVAALLAMSIIPAVLVLLSGSSIITNSTALWFNDSVSDVLSASQTIASRWYQDHMETMALRAETLAGRLPAADVASGNDTGLDAIVRTELSTLRDGMIEVYRAVSEPGRATDVALVTAVESPTLARDTVRASTASADRIASRVVTSGVETATEDQLESGGVLVRSAWPVRDADKLVVGAVVVSRHLPAQIRAEAQRATTAYQRYQSLFILREPLQGFFVSIFVTVTLLILISATWLGLYLAKRITRPVQQLAEGARAIGEGRLDVRLEPESGDELGSLVEAFNMMAAELSTSREKLEQSTRDLARKNIEVDARRRYIETILERVATGVISLDAAGRILTVNGAASRLLGLDASSLGRPAREVFGRDDLQPVLALVDAIDHRDQRALVQEITLALADREIHLAAAATILTGNDRRAEGSVLVLDDVTPLIRAQRVAAWRDVARRLAHEIKNPLTPIQLSAERLRRHFSNAPPSTTALVGECTDAIITEVEALKGLVDEFAQFARLRGPRMVPTSLNRLVDDTLNLYGAMLQRGRVRLERRLEADLPAVRLDAEQIRQVIINLVDNAVEALDGLGTSPAVEDPTIVVTTTYDARNGVVRLVVSDNGPGVPAADREKLFMPYYSTKGRGSGLGLAIVRRIVVEHGGGIEAAPARPSGTTFTVELPAA